MIIIQLLLCLIDSFPFKLSVLSIISHVVYLGNMRKFPIVRLSDPLFLSSCGMYPPQYPHGRRLIQVVLVLLNHYVWFRHFSDPSNVAPQSRYDTSNVPTFTEIASYFGICVWLVPFSLFVSLSAGDNVLPTMGSEAPGMGGSDGRNKRQGMIKVLVDGVLGWIGEVSKMAGWGGRSEKRGF
jgi:hypothetical protein